MINISHANYKLGHLLERARVSRDRAEGRDLIQVLEGAWQIRFDTVKLKYLVINTQDLVKNSDSETMDNIHWIYTVIGNH